MSMQRPTGTYVYLPFTVTKAEGFSDLGFLLSFGGVEYILETS
jgi:hypothetical protein